MEEINLRLETFNQTLAMLDKSIQLFRKTEQTLETNNFENAEDLFLATRESMIQRFKYCTDIMWKVLKTYLEDVQELTLEILSPRSVIRQSVTARILSEEEGAFCMKMVENRNKTSHIYHQEIAEQIAAQVPAFYAMMKTIAERVKLESARSR